MGARGAGSPGPDETVEGRPLASPRPIRCVLQPPGSTRERLPCPSARVLARIPTPEAWRDLLANAWEDYARFSLRGRIQRSVTSDSREDVSNHLDHASRCLEESLGVYPPGSEQSLAATVLLAAVAMEQGQLDRASALLTNAREKRLPSREEGADG